MLRIINLPVMIVWREFNVGTSIFIPCLDRDAVEDYILDECRRAGIEVTSKQVVHNDMYGVRVWRTK